jgi:branched-chain amino acid transport system substrate-binding protein
MIALATAIAAISQIHTQHPKVPPSVPLPTLSSGEQVLLSTNLPSLSDRIKGTKAFATGQFDDAITDFRRALHTQHNDPETLIYLNNAIAQKSGNPIKLAVAIPIQNNPDVAQELLRGVAQAQSQENCGLETLASSIAQPNRPLDCSRGIQGRKLLIQIADDQDNPTVGQQVAQVLAADPSIMGIVGHRSSAVTQAVEGIYKAQKVPFITPTSSADALSQIHNPYFFRTVHTNADAGKALVQYVQSKGYTKVAIAFAQNDSGSRTLREDVRRALDSQSFVYECDFSLGDLFNTEECIAQSEKQQADILLLAPSTNYLDAALKLIDLNNGRLRLAGTDVLYDGRTIKNYGEESALSDLVVSTSWYRTDSPFEQNARQLWGNVEVNWRTAMSYDATKALIQGLWNANCDGRSNCRERLRQAIASPTFSSEGVAGESSVKFLTSGNRNLQSLDLKLGGIVQVQQKADGSYGFVPIP